MLRPEKALLHQHPIHRLFVLGEDQGLNRRIFVDPLLVHQF